MILTVVPLKVPHRDFFPVYPSLHREVGDASPFMFSQPNLLSPIRIELSGYPVQQTCPAETYHTGR